MHLATINMERPARKLGGAVVGITLPLALLPLRHKHDYADFDSIGLFLDLLLIVLWTAERTARAANYRRSRNALPVGGVTVLAFSYLLPALVPLALWLPLSVMVMSYHHGTSLEQTSGQLLPWLLAAYFVCTWRSPISSRLSPQYFSVSCAR